MARSILPGPEHAGTNFLAGFPFERELADCPPDEVAIVDVGGGYGHLLKAVRSQLPGVKGKLVLEDLPETVAAAGHIGDNIDVQPYNFLKDMQPVKGEQLISLSLSLSPKPRSLNHGSRLTFLVKVLGSTSCATSSMTGQITSRRRS